MSERVHPAEQHWWTVTRRYTVEDVVYVEADSASEAKQKAVDGYYDDISPGVTVGQTTHRKATRIPDGKPKDLWETRDWEVVEREQNR